jgi:serine/threonine-protein kinase
MSAPALQPAAAERGPARAAASTSRVSHTSYARRSLLWLLLPLAAGVLLLVRYLAGGGTDDSDTVTVLPFAAGGAGTSAAVLADGMADGLAEALARLPGVLVVSTAGAGAGVLPADAREAGRLLGARLVVSGRAERQGDTLAVSAELLEVATGERRGGGGAVRPLDALLAAEEELAADVARTLRPAATTRLRDTLRRQRAAGVAARMLLMRARFLAREDGAQARLEAIACLVQATHDSPSYARAHGELAVLHLRAAAAAGDPAAARQALESARAAAARALAIEPEIGEAVAARGRTEHLLDRDLAAAERSLRRAVELAPSSATAHLWLGDLLAELGRRREAEKVIRAAARLEPLSPEAPAALARIGAGR